MRVGQAKELFRALTQQYFGGANVVFANQSRTAKQKEPLVVLTPGNVHRPQAPNYTFVDGEVVGHYLSRFSITVDLFTNGSPVVDEVSGKVVAYEDNAVDDMLSFADFLNSEHTVQWSHQNDVSILIDGDVLNLTGVVNDTSYEFRSRLTVQFYFTQKAVGASTALLESSLQYPTGEKDPETQEPTYTPTEPPETDSKSGPWGDEEEPIVVPTFEPSASGGGTEELAKEETGYFTEVETKEETGNE